MLMTPAEYNNTPYEVEPEKIYCCNCYEWQQADVNGEIFKVGYCHSIKDFTKPYDTNEDLEFSCEWEERQCK